MRTLLALITLLLAGVASASDGCSSSEAEAAEIATGTFKTWPAIYSGFKRYRHCDDGGIAEGFTEAVVHLLASTWNSLPEAAAFVQKDPAF